MGEQMMVQTAMASAAGPTDGMPGSGSPDGSSAAGQCKGQSNPHIMKPTIPLGKLTTNPGKRHVVYVQKSPVKDSIDFPVFESRGGRDSGCVSDVSSGPGDIVLVPNVAMMEASLQRVPSESSDAHSDSSSQHSISNLSNISSLSSGSDAGSVNSRVSKTQYNVKYGKNGPIKFLKPLKDIPPRFQKILSSNPSIKQSKFEGQPLVRQGMLGKGKGHGSNHSGSSPRSNSSAGSPTGVLDTNFPACTNFNPNAQCFVPSQSFDCNNNGSQPPLTYSSTSQTYAMESAYCINGSAPYGDGSSYAPYNYNGNQMMSNAPTYTIVINGPPQVPYQVPPPAPTQPQNAPPPNSSSSTSAPTGDNESSPACANSVSSTPTSSGYIYGPSSSPATPSQPGQQLPPPPPQNTVYYSQQGYGATQTFFGYPPAPGQPPPTTVVYNNTPAVQYAQYPQPPQGIPASAATQYSYTS